MRPALFAVDSIIPDTTNRVVSRIGGSYSIVCTECGKTRTNNASIVRQSCTCQPANAVRLSIQGRGKHRSPSNVLARYKRSARDRGIEWNLSRSAFMELIACPCSYCGGEGGGVDRVDSSEGYGDGNVQPCCKTCNLMKNDLTVPEFFAHLAKIALKHGILPKS